MGEDAFSKATTEILAKRAAYQCSNPDCQAKTIGPSDADSAKAINVGVASHITANSAGGPRYDSSLTSEQRRHPDNGIWLCQTCSRLVDTNGGADHPVDLLRRWKAEHETNVARSIGKREQSELAGTIEAEGIGEIIAADLRRPTRMAPGTHVRASGTGKIAGVRTGYDDGNS
jgi:hypothetical protein